MRKLIVLTFLSLDGVMQAPGGPEEDPSEGFEYGGWTPPYSDKESLGEMQVQWGGPYDLVLGRKTYDIFARYWPNADLTTEPAKGINNAMKYVATHHPLSVDWKNSVRIEGDIVEGIKTIKRSEGPDLHSYGSGNLFQTLFQHDLVDELWLKFYPVTLGKGRRLFEGGAIPAAFELTHCKATPKGVIFANYRRNGDVKTGCF